MRNASSSWIGKTVMALVMGVLIVSFGVWGIADIFRGFGQSTLAKIGRTEISTEQFRHIYVEKLQQIGRQFGRPLTQDQARSFGIDRQVVQQVVAEAALDEKARRIGLGQSEAETMRNIVNDPNFRGVNGSFDSNRFAQTIRQYGYTEQRYLNEQRRVSLRRQLAGTITNGLEPPKTLLDALSQHQNEQRSIEYVKFGPAQAGEIEDPSPEILAAYFSDHKTQFRAPEYRKINFALLTPESLSRWETISDEDARKFYEVNGSKLGTPEKRRVTQIVFPNAEEAQAARTRLVAGMTVEDLVKERGLNPSDVDLGLVAKPAILDPAVGEAAFALPIGEFSEPVAGRFGTALIRVEGIAVGAQQTYEQTAMMIKQGIAVQRGRTMVAELHNKMEDARGGGASLAEAAPKLGITPVTIEIDRSGRSPEGAIAPLPQGLDLPSSAFASDVGVDNDALSFSGGYVWYEVLGITPSRERPLEEVKPQVEARWKADQIAVRLRTKSAELVQKLEQGGNLTELATADGLTIDNAADFKRDATPDGLPASAVAAVFRAAKDAWTQTEGVSGSDWIVFRVTTIAVPPADPDSADAKKLKDDLQRRIADEQVAQYVGKLEAEIGTTINESAVAQATGASTN